MKSWREINIWNKIFFLGVTFLILAFLLPLILSLFGNAGMEILIFTPPFLILGFLLIIISLFVKPFSRKNN
ncbi:hypothetical protein HYV49_01280 [Candidatus Pacearchaeota archaeon]|nr:hypothetical protein [Candidatus Pacearchaeota archaeon]